MGRFIAMVMGILGALGGSQAPGFTLQYMQNLSGRIDELRPVVEKFDADIAAFGYSRDQALLECADAERLLKALCATYETTVRRYEELTAHFATLTDADDLRRPLVLVRNYKRDIAENVMTQFQPAVPATPDGVIYAGGGFAALWGGLTFVFGLLGAMFGMNRRYA
ncbi:MAG: DUF2937 family protein [Pseudomonadota bacterium]